LLARPGGQLWPGIIIHFGRRHSSDRQLPGNWFK